MLSTSVQKFYEQQAESWDSSRQASWEGTEMLFSEEKLFPSQANIRKTKKLLELGCGNGRFLSKHLSNLPELESYLGIDISTNLLKLAKARIASLVDGLPRQLNYSLVQADLTGPDWTASMSDSKYELALMIATLHHIPPKKARKLFLQISEHLDTGALFIFSSWQFLPQLSNLVVSCDKLENYLSENQLKLGPADYMLSWQKSSSYRYAHLYGRQEIIEMISGLPFKIVYEFDSDGRNSKLNHYYILQRT